MNKLNNKFYAQRFIALTLLLLSGVSLSSHAQDSQTNIGDAPLFRGEQLLLTGSYAAAVDVFLLTDGLDRSEGLVGASVAYSMMGNYQEAMRIVESGIDDEE